MLWTGIVDLSVLRDLSPGRFYTFGPSAVQRE